MALPTHRSVYECLCEGLAPSLTALQLKPVGSFPRSAWRSTVDNEGNVVFLSFQVDSKGTDPFSGGKFRVELEKSRQRRPALGLNGRALYFQLLTRDERQLLLDQQNRFIDRLPKPPPRHAQLYPEGIVRETYLEYFQHQLTFDAVRCWLRYLDETDIMGWVPLLSQLVQPLVERASIFLSPDRRDLGRGYLLLGP